MVEASEKSREDASSGSLQAAAGFVRDYLRRPFSFYLISLLLIAIIPPFIFSFVILQRNLDAQREEVTSLLRASTGSVTRIVEREVDGMLTTLRVLAKSGAVDLADMRGLYERASVALADTDSHLIIVDANHDLLLSTRVPFGTPLGRASDPEIDLALQSTAPLVSGVFPSEVGRGWVFTVYLPVTTPDGKKYLLGLRQDAERMTRAVNRDTLSPGWNAALVDGKGRVIVSSDSSVKSGDPFFLDELPLISIGVGNISAGGVDYRVASEFSVVTGWRIVAWAPSEIVDQPMLWSFLWLSFGGIIFASIAVAGSLTIARLLTQGVRLLAMDARRLGAGEPVEPRRYMITEVEAVSTALASAATARAKAESEIRLLMREVAHRAKNQLTVIQSMLAQSANSAEEPSDFVEAFRKRLAGLARSTDLMVANAASGVDFRELVRNQLQPFMPAESDRVVLSGPALRLDAQMAQTLGMALHELATNAIKHGALANQTGMIKVEWSVGEGAIDIRWRESGADIVAPSGKKARRGFGTVVLERMLGLALRAELERTMHADGIEWRIRIPRGKDHSSQEAGG
ncbi:sensor histidine kinase [Sinorhizobium meliloti]|uniref:sensor histidine kinase n=1 Tax=Rhizobium meliloti TaxID=382 RepID=UPI000FD773F1|nr:sensor histidine kinase [Sinorhizobium meliloti]RVH16905.1 histidine kinase [Sinorhizobium meliloti]